MKKGLLISIICSFIIISILAFIGLPEKSGSMPDSKKVKSEAGEISKSTPVKSSAQNLTASSNLTSTPNSETISGEKEFFNKSKYESEEEESYENGFMTPERKRELLGLVPQREMMIEHGKSDSPDLFRKFEVGIRTKINEEKPGYEYNYKWKEYRKYASSNGFKKPYGVQAITPVERGPGNVSGRTRGIIVDPDDPTLNTWFAGSVGGGIWKTTNAGQSWELLTPDLPNLATSTLAMAMSNHNVIYAGTGEGFFNIDQIDGSGVWKSTDKGQTWNPLPSTTNNPEFENITRIIVDPSNENIVLLTSTSGFFYNGNVPVPTSKIYRSTDGGTTWDIRVQTNGSLEQIIANPLNFNTQYASLNSTAILKSWDGGMTWFNSSNGIGPVGRMEIGISPSDTSRIYFSAQGGASGSVLYVSDNGGAQWFSMSDTSGVDQNWLGGQGWYDNTIAVDPYNRDIVYVGGINLWKLFHVFGSDTSAQQVTSVDQVNTQSFLAFVNWGGRYAGGGLDLGEFFHGLPTNLTDDEYTSVEIRFGPGLTQKAHRFTAAAAFQYPYLSYETVPFQVWDTDNNRQLMVSFRDHDGNGTWNPKDRASAPGGISREYIFIHAVEYDSTGPDTNIAQTAGMAYKNTYAFWPEAPNGVTFDPNNLPNSLVRINWGTFITRRLSADIITDGYMQFGGTPKGVHVDHHNILLIKTDEATESYRLVNGNDGGVSYSDDKGNTFLQPKNGYNTTQFYGVDKMNGADRYIGGTQDNGTWFSPDNPTDTSSWSPAPSGDGFEAAWHYNDPNLILETSQYNNIFKSTDMGMTWFPAGASNGLTDQGGANSPFITKIADSKQDPDLVFAIGSSGVWRSDDFADSWTLTPVPPGFDGSNIFADIKTSLVNPQIVWAGQAMTMANPLFVSTDGGLSFDSANIFTDVPLGFITGIETHPTDENTAYALFSFANTAKILRTTDLGQTWSDISGFGTDSVSSAGFPDVAVYSLLVMPFNTNIIWAGTEIGIFQTTDGGGSWSYLDSQLPATAIWDMVIVNDEVAVATHGRGIWSISVTELAGYEPLPAVLSPRLNPVAQNPAGFLVIQFDLRSPYDSSHVMINQDVFLSLPANGAPADSTVFFPVMTTRTDSIQVIAYKNGNVYKSYMRIIESKVLNEPVFTYYNNFNTDTSDFSGTGFSFITPPGFSSRALHSPHPYLANTNNTIQLLTPIKLKNTNPYIAFMNIAIIEPGEPGSVFGDADFYDYVIVEATKDGINWIPLADGYDARSDSSGWLERWNSQQGGDSTLFKAFQANMLDKFSVGDTVLIRFRLFADAGAEGWGWAIDDLCIQLTTKTAELTAFSGKADDSKVTLTWETEYEQYNRGFDVERSTDNKTFVKVQHVPGKGTTYEKQNYTFTDNSSNGGKFYYRLKTIDLDGQFTYSEVIEVKAIPLTYALSQNYPNPFNPATTIKYQIPQQDRVVLEIFNSIGEKVKTLVDAVNEPGYYQVNWDGTNNNSASVASGVYIYRITAGKFVVSKKMMIMK